MAFWTKNYNDLAGINFKKYISTNSKVSPYCLFVLRIDESLSKKLVLRSCIIFDWSNWSHNKILTNFLFQHNTKLYYLICETYRSNLSNHKSSETNALPQQAPHKLSSACIHHNCIKL